MGHFGPKNCTSSILITLDLLEDFFFKSCTMKGANRYMKMILIIFQKKIVWGKCAILGPKVVYPQISGSLIGIFFKFCTMKSANR